jgi:hypothetical protein
MEAGRPSPLKVQISYDGDYKPGFSEAVKKRFVEIGGQLKTKRTEKQKFSVASLQWKSFLVRICRTGSGTLALLPVD